MNLGQETRRLLRPRSMRLRVFFTVMLAALVPLVFSAVVEAMPLPALVRLALVVLPVAGVLAFWLAWRVIRPLEALRAQALEMAPRADAHPNLDMQRQDEFGDLAQAFNALLATLEERQRQNAAFVADLAHEFKNPVAAIRAAAEALEGGAADERRSQRLAGVLKGSSARLDGLVTQFLELARAEAGMPSETRGGVDLAALVQGAVQQARLRNEPPGVDFQCSGAAVARVEGVPARLESVVRNLMDNAASFAGPGGWVRVQVEETPDAVLLHVEDSGPGIPAENLPRMFERFFSTRASGRGTGLGLALVKAVVEAHGGRVAVASPAGRGAQFTVELPVRAARR